MTEQEKAEIVKRVRERIIDGMAFTRWPPTKQTVEVALEAVDFFELIEAAKYALTPTDQDIPYDLR